MAAPYGTATPICRAIGLARATHKGGRQQSAALFYNVESTYSLLAMVTNSQQGITALILTLALASAGILHAEPRANERIALALSGQNCSPYHQSIAKTLSQVPGVTRIDMTLIDGHVLIDRIQDQRTAEDFRTIVNSILPSEAQCRAEIMESCISADPMPPSNPH